MTMTVSNSREQAKTLFWQDLLQLTKPTISLLVVVTAVPGLLLALPTLPSASLLLMTLIGAGLASGSAATFNQIVERQSDLKMARTMERSVAEGRVPVGIAALFGTLLGILGLWLLWTGATPLAAWAALAGHVFYVVIYTLFLKRRTVQNIVIGGAAGAVGPLIGWAAAGQGLGLSAWPAWVMFLIIFLWTPPHFWALALKYKDDYQAAGIPMYPVVKGVEQTKKVMFLYTLTLFPPVILLYFANGSGPVYLVAGLALTSKFAWDAWKLKTTPGIAKAMPLFHYSCVYTLLLFAVLSIETYIARI